MSDGLFFILDVQHSDDFIQFWLSHTEGRSAILSEAGRYSREVVEADPDYWNDHEATFAVPVDEVLALAEPWPESKNVNPPLCVKAEHLEALKSKALGRANETA